MAKVKIVYTIHTMVTEWILFITTFIVGFLLGQGSISLHNLQEAKKELQKKLTDQRVGAISRPSAQTINKRQDPIAQGSERAMIETLSKIPELNMKG